jgi:hypothetical protein
MAIALLIANCGSPQFVWMFERVGRGRVFEARHKPHFGSGSGCRASSQSRLDCDLHSHLHTNRGEPELFGRVALLLITCRCQLIPSPRSIDSHASGDCDLDFMYLFQSIALTVGTTIIGFSLASYGSIFLALALLPQKRGEMGWLPPCCLFLPVGFGFLGAIAGFFSGWRLAPRYANDTWGSVTWLGVIVGLLLAWWVFGAFSLTAWWPARLVVSLSGSTVAGVAANRAEVLLGSRTSRLKTRMKRKPGRENRDVGA